MTNTKFRIRYYDGGPVWHQRGWNVQHKIGPFWISDKVSGYANGGNWTRPNTYVTQEEATDRARKLEKLFDLPKKKNPPPINLELD